jgi:hypothetical protein
MNIDNFCNIIATGGMRYNGSCISWGRSVQHNHDEGGHENSFHLSWLAADVFFDTIDESKQAERFYKRMGLWVKRNGAQTAMRAIGLALAAGALTPEVQASMAAAMGPYAAFVPMLIALLSGGIAVGEKNPKPE